MSDINPVPQRRRLGAQLRGLRERQGLTLDGVAERLECSTAKVSRIEHGRVALRVQDLRDLADLYGVEGAEREQLMAEVRQARRRAWWRPYSNVMPDGFDVYVGLEGEAATVHSYQVTVVEGLLQTESYARALLGLHRDLPDEVVDRRVKLRIARQQILSGDNPPILHVLLDESVLLRPVGGKTVMVEQCRHLAAMAARPEVTVQVIPLSAAAEHPPNGFPFVILGFADPAEPKVVYTEHLVRNEILEKAEDVGRYLATFDYQRAAALTPDTSVALINHTADQLVAQS